MVINELMSSRKWKGAKVWLGNAATGKNSITRKILQPAKFGCVGGAKAEHEKFAHQCKNWAGQKKKERCHGAARICHCQNLAPRQNFKSVKMIINYGG
jgi:predicted secreted hydrolase